MECGQEEGFGVVEDGGAKQLEEGAENKEVDKGIEKEAAEKVADTNARGKFLLTVQEAENLTQQSATALNTKEGGVLEEELLDYDEDPLVAEKLAMAELEKRVEQRANEMVKEVSINIHSEKGVTDEKAGSGSDNTSEGTEEEEIDWDEIQVALDMMILRILWFHKTSI
jgi:hypothetical protein